jgi:hypothetical protein
MSSKDRYSSYLPEYFMCVKQSAPYRLDVRVITRVRVRNPFIGAFRKSFEKRLDGRISLILLPEVVSKPQIAFESKTQADENAQHTHQYVSTLKRSVMHFSVIELPRIPLRGVTQLSDDRWGFETTSQRINDPEFAPAIVETLSDFIEKG